MAWTKEQRDAYDARHSVEFLRNYMRDYKKNLTPEQRSKYNATQRARRARLSEEKKAAYKEKQRQYKRTEEQRKRNYQSRKTKRQAITFTPDQIEADRRYKREWNKSHPETTRVNWVRYRARKLNAEGSFTKKEWRETLDRFDHRCAICRCTGKMTVDHIVPLSKGGSNWISNIQPLCVSCNSRKNNRLQEAA